MVNFSRQSNNAIVKWWWTIDKVILFVSLALLAIGIILDITASPAVARRQGSDDYFFIRKQIVYVLLSVGVIFSLSLFKLKTVRRISILGFIVLMALLQVGVSEEDVQWVARDGSVNQVGDGRRH